MAVVKPTVVIAINTSWNIYNFRLGLIRALQEKGWRVVALAPTDEYVTKLEAVGVEHHPIRIDNKGTNPLEDFRLFMEYRKRYREIRPDVVLHYTIKPNIYGTIAAASLGIPVIANITGLGTVFLRKGLASLIARRLYRAALRHPRRVFFQNPTDRDLFLRLGLVEASRSGLLPGSGVDTERFRPLPDTTRPPALRYLFIGRLLQDKGLREYVAAARSVHKRHREEGREPPRFSILGAYYPGNPSAISRHEMEAWVREGVVEYLGTCQDVRPVIAAHDCVVLPSYREGLSRVLLEAAAMARPLIASDVPGCRDVVKEGINGLLCRVADADALAEAMERFAAMGVDERQALGERGRKLVLERFDEHLVIARYLEEIEALPER